ncbi:MAG TPA: ABC transporter permease [Bacillota bacterium]|jgi:ABC-type Na+ efflux pump permease subunit|nr:ABC transporter permease [Bacillota bacterium]HOL08833.1 ABC transporter permease [Bacillota bacterium]HPO98461.1 ABC transporter permease [Bacillota bacterium]
MNYKHILVLLEKDYREFFSSKAWIVAMVFPLFIAFIFGTVYREAENTKFKIAYLESEAETPLIKLLSAANIATKPYPSLTDARQALKRNDLDAVIYTNTKSENRFSLLIPGNEVKKGLLITNAINIVLIQQFSNESIPQVELEYAGKTIENRWLALPLWLIQIILTVCFLQNTATIAEEKSKKTLHSFLVSPASMSDYLVAKMLWNSAIGLASLILTIVLTGYKINLPNFLIFGLLGCLFFASLSLLIAIASPHALFARTLSTCVYFVSSLPLMAKDIDLGWKDILNILPTIQIFNGFEAAIMRNALQLNSLTTIISLLIQTGLMIWITALIYHQKKDF